LACDIEVAQSSVIRLALFPESVPVACIDPSVTRSTGQKNDPLVCIEVTRTYRSPDHFSENDPPVCIEVARTYRSPDH
jgi:hypothetical protein